MDDKKITKAEQLKYISDITYIEESSNLHLILKGVIAVSLLVFGFIIWSGFVTITETTKANGQLIPEGEIQVVQHLEGGIVEKVHVNDGDIVKRGQLLLELSTTELESQLDELRSSEVSLLLNGERLRAFVNRKSPNPEAWSKRVIQSKYNLVKNKSEVDDLVKSQILLLEAEYAELQHKKAGLENTLAQRKEKLHELTNKKKIWEEHIKLLEQEYQMYGKLKTKDYISHKDYLTIMRTVNQSRGEGAQIDSEIDQTKSAIQEVENKLKENESVSREEALTELSKTQSNLLEVYHKIAKATQQIERSDIRSPVSGVVKGIAVFRGNVAKPGAVLLEIVPETGKLVGEIQILPRDVGYTKVGQQVRVNVTTYDYARYGSIAGELISISAATFKDSEGRPYYQAKVKLEKQYIGADNNQKRLKAGMVIEADIITGSKSLLAYLLRPIHRSVTESFHER